MVVEDFAPGAALQEWVASWGELADFEIVPVTASRETQDLMARLG